MLGRQKVQKAFQKFKKRGERPRAFSCQTKTTGYARGSKEAEADDEK
jgi:hypothetical protein